MTKEELEKMLNDRNEAVKVWITAETQTREYCCILEKEIQRLQHEIGKLTYETKVSNAQKK